MAELEIHHEHEGGEKDPLGQKIGILASLLAVCLAVVTIASHRAHTDGVLMKADENDKWSFYQAKKIKQHNLELGLDLSVQIGAKDADAQERAEHYKSEIARYTKDADKASDEANAMEEKMKILEDKALRYDFGEGLIEIGVVLSSLYFISKKTYFPLLGLVAGVCGIVAAVSGLLK